MRRPRMIEALIIHFFFFRLPPFSWHTYLRVHNIAIIWRSQFLFTLTTLFDLNSLKKCVRNLVFVLSDICFMDFIILLILLISTF